MIDPRTFETRKMLFVSLGCKLNFTETSTLAKTLMQAGYTRVRPGEKPDICLVNTCSVTETADKKSRQAIHRLIRNYPEACVVVTGCYAQLKAQEIAAIPGVDLVLGANEKFDLPAYLDDLKKQEKAVVEVGAQKSIVRFQPSCSRGDRTRYFLKVQDGCDYYCSYCTIPYARGRSRNPSIDFLVEQASQVAAEGGKEIVLSGVNIGDFGKSNGERFVDLLRALDGVDGIERYRISSLEPDLLTDEIIAFTAGSRRFAPHFHLPLQGGDDELLALMKRRYDTALFASRVQRIRREMPDAFIGVDVIVGSRGETPERFERSYDFLSGLEVSQLHVFTYSERPGTQALKIEPVVSMTDRKRRSARLLELSDRKWHAFYEGQVGKVGNVLFEHTQTNGSMQGFTENYVRVEMPYEAARVNVCSSVRLEGFNDDQTALKGQFFG